MKAEQRDGYTIEPHSYAGKQMNTRMWRLADRERAYVVRVQPRKKYASLDIDDWLADKRGIVNWEPLVRKWHQKGLAGWGGGLFIEHLLIDDAIAMAEEAVALIRAAGGKSL